MPAKKTAKKSPASSTAQAAADGARSSSLLSIARGDVPLSEAQRNFNKLTAQLEKARARFDSRERELEKFLEIHALEVMPLEKKLSEAKYQLTIRAYEALKTANLSSLQREYALDVIHKRASEVLNETIGLSEEQMAQIRTILTELEGEDEDDDGQDYGEFPGSTGSGGAGKSNSATHPNTETLPPEGAAEFVAHVKHIFRMQFGVELNLDGIDFTQHPSFFEAELQKRMHEARAEAGRTGFPPGFQGPKPRKMTKAQQAKALREAEAEKAKLMDLKTLYKQLAKVLHPDLETDPARKLQKQEWMQRLTKAHAAGDLHELLSIEMQWLGVESSNLATATDQKLKVYAAVLKEQIAEVKMHTHELPFQPRFMSLHHFLPPFGYGISNESMAEYAVMVRQWTWELKEELAKLNQPGSAGLKLLKQWAKEAKEDEQDQYTGFW